MTGVKESPKDLLRLAEDPSRGGRRMLADTISDLFAERQPALNDRERALIGDILKKLIADFETAMRREMAERLAARDAVPQEVIVALANDEIAVAQPILLHSPLLRDRELIAVIRNRSRQHQMSIAMRDMVSEAVSDVLVETADRDVITTLLGNNNARISDATLNYLVEEARQVDSYQEPLVLREDLSAELAKKIFTCVAAELKDRLVARFDLDPEVLDREFEGLPSNLVDDDGDPFGEVAPRSASQDLARILGDSREITPELMIKVLRGGKVDLFEALFGQVAGLRAPILQQVLYGSEGKAFAAACRALGVPKSRFIELFLLIRRAQTKSNTTPAREVGTVVQYFDRITPAIALEAMRHWHGDGDEGHVAQAGGGAR